MESRYDPALVEKKIYEQWERSGFFDPDVCIEKGVTKKDAEQFSIVLPPPNVTGTLHMGHAAMLVIEDIMVRYHRMRGERTLWIPGTDHAAIATQSKVEREIVKEEKKNRHDLGREEFLRRVRAFAQESHDTIVDQVKRMGASLDWGREAYTLDDKREVAVRTAFKKMYDLGLIYRGHRVVNWDVKGQTTISDEEIVYEERRAKLYTFRYGLLANGEEFPIPISTTRLETKFGDTAVAVHPSDERYKKFVGKEFDVDFCGTPIHIKVVADESVEKDFGTGALGVTPAHSMIDWEIAQRHDLPFKQIIDEYGRMTVENPLVHGKKTPEAREIAAEELRKHGLIEKEEEISQNVATAERTGGIIEPLPKLQWFVAVNKKFGDHEKTLKELMKGAVTGADGIKILPERFERIYLNWIDNLRDWCISRQIWFGHRIPVWYCLHCKEPNLDPEITARWFLVRHGETDFNKENRLQGSTNPPLNDAGRAQIRDVGRALKNENIELIISSDYERAKETADIIKKEIGYDGSPVLEKQFRERSFGIVEGMVHDDAYEKYGDKFHTYNESWEGGETFEDVEKRAMPTFEKYRRDHPGKNILIVTHGGVIRALRRVIKNVAPDQIYSGLIPKLDNAGVVTLEIGTACKNCGHDLYEQDPDTLDTWFSSGLWPFSTLGWPEKTADLKTYFPNSVLETGYDIIFFWVARMILMSEVLMGEAPFKRVYLHGLVRDDKGRKMSKSLGNIIDPLTMADKYGADATRLSLVIGAAAGNDIKLSEDRIRGYRNFSTKIWNIARFIQMNKPEGESSKNIPAGDRVEIKELAELKKEVTEHIHDFEFHLAGEKLYHYVWHRLADEIVEQEKPKLHDGTDAEKARSYALLETLLLDSLKMLHPFMPFITEEIYQIFRPGKMLMVERW